MEFYVFDLVFPEITQVKFEPVYKNNWQSFEHRKAKIKSNYSIIGDADYAISIFFFFFVENKIKNINILCAMFSLTL